jgi:translation elongation factor EF-Ts
MTGRFEPEPMTAGEVWAYRERTGSGMIEAKKHVKTRKLKEALGYLRELGTLEDKVEFLLDRFAKTLK